MHRLAALSIILFWVAMTTLLVRNELTPGSSSVREVPLHHVLKLLYLHDEPSDLRIFSDTRLIGSLHLQPHIDRAKRLCLLEFNGTVQLQLTPQVRQRISWDGLLELDIGFTFRRLNLGFTLHDASATRVEILTQANSNKARVTLKQRDQIVSTQEFTLDEAGGRRLLTEVGGDPALLSAITGTQIQAGWQIRARQSFFLIKNERVDTYLVTIDQAGQPVAEINIDQLGSVLHGKTALGYTFAPDDVAP